MPLHHFKTEAQAAACASALALAAMLAGCGRNAPGEAAAASAAAPMVVHDGGRITVAEASPLRKTLQVVAVQAQSIERPINVPAVVEADPARLLKVVPPLSGRIVRLHKQLGDTVRVGEALVSLDSADLAQAFSDASKAQAALALAARNLQRQKELADAGISARKDLEQAESDEAQARAELARTHSRLALLGTSLQASQGREYTLSSPIAGRVIDLVGAQGGFWNDTTAPVMTVADLSSVWVTASVQEKDLAALFVGQPARISLNAYEGETVTGKVKFIGEILDADTRTVKVRIVVDNAAGRFRPGMFAKVVFSGQPHQALVVPATALVQSGFDTRVFVEQSPGVFVARKVTTGAQIDDRVEITAGLKAGERVVAKDGVLLND
jgi:cobalt-zinc-cadmium efflux system membrane fusion protein